MVKASSEFLKSPSGHDKHGQQVKPVLVQQELLAVGDLGLQPKHNANINDADDNQSGNEALEVVNDRCDDLVCRSCGHVYLSSDKPGILSSLLEILTDTLVTFIAGFAVGSWFAIDAIVDPIKASGL